MNFYGRTPLMPRTERWDCFLKGYIGGRLSSLSFFVNALDSQRAYELMMDQAKCSGMTIIHHIEMEQGK